MAEDRFSATSQPRDPWLFTHLFRTFRIALDPQKLLLAAGGIVTMAVGWWLLSVVFYAMWKQPTKDKYQARTVADFKRDKPGKTDAEYEELRAKSEEQQNREFNEDSDRWLQLHRLAGSEYAKIEYATEGGVQRPARRIWGGRLRALPWYEDRGPNPYLLVTNKTERPWEKGHFVDWLMYSEVPVLLEPLVKFLTPIVEILNPHTSTYTRVYLLLVIVWTLATWALFGGAITRMAAVELAGKDSVTIREALEFVWRRYVSYLLAPMVPLILVAVLVVVSAIFGLLHMIPFVGDIFVSGIFWPVMVLVGLGMALLLVGLVGYPLMYPTISTEGSDTLDALTRSYNYVFTSPWSYVGYGLLTVLYGAVVIFFVGFMGSLTVYLGKWGMSNTPLIKSANRSPEFLFIYTPTSFGWREVLLEDSPGGPLATLDSEVSALRFKKDGDELDKLVGAETAKGKEHTVAEARNREWLDSFWMYNKVGAAMVSFWITLLFLMVLGFGYSFFWTASTTIYLLMRKNVDEMDLDEVYLEEMRDDDLFAPAPTTPLQTIPQTAPSGGSTLQSTLTVRQDRPAPPPSPPEPPPTPPGEGPPPTP